MAIMTHSRIFIVAIALGFLGGFGAMALGSSIGAGMQVAAGH